MTSTGPLPPSERPDGVSPTVLAVIGIVAALVLIGVVALVLTADDGDDVAIDGELQATPLASASDPSAAPTPTPTAVTTATPSSTATPTPTPTPTGPREPTDSDGAAYATRITPPGAQDGETLLADLDGDGRNEVVLVVRLGEQSLLQIGVWDGSAYDTVLRSEGGTAAEIIDVAVRDVNGTPESAEIVVRQRSGTQGESISLWGLSFGAYAPLEAADGCWSGSHTYGITGATIDADRSEIVATCDGSPDPIPAWPSDVYRWDPELETFAFERRIQPVSATPTPTPTVTPSKSEDDDPVETEPVPTAQPD